MLGDPRLEQAHALSALAVAAARFFSEPSQAQAGVVREHAEACRAKAGAVRSGASRDDREEMLTVSRHLSEAAVQVGKAVEECQLFQVPAGRRLSGAFEPLCEAAQALERSFRALTRGGGQGCVDLVLDAKRHCQQASRLASEAVKQALEMPNTVDSIKFKETFVRFSRSADEIHQAADLIGELAAVKND
ncbi:MAG: hypothetical protein HY924_12375 [Elusimicrobia bacterium]|nr:hypothetical protein [Elusimicrobiota bacterium]